MHTSQVDETENHPVIRVSNLGNMRGSVKVRNPTLVGPSGTSMPSPQAVELHPRSLQLEPGQDAALMAEVSVVDEGDYVYRCELVDQEDNVVAQVTLQLTASAPTFEVAPGGESLEFGTTMVGGSSMRTLVLQSTSVWPIDYDMHISGVGSSSDDETGAADTSLATAIGDGLLDWWTIEAALNGTVHARRQLTVGITFRPTRGVRRAQAMLHIRWGKRGHVTRKRLVASADRLDLRWRVVPFQSAVLGSMTSLDGGPVAGGSPRASPRTPWLSPPLGSPGRASEVPLSVGYVPNPTASREALTLGSLAAPTAGVELYSTELPYAASGMTQATEWGTQATPADGSGPGIEFGVVRVGHERWVGLQVVNHGVLDLTLYAEPPAPFIKVKVSSGGGGSNPSSRPGSRLQSRGSSRGAIRRPAIADRVKGALVGGMDDTSDARDRRVGFVVPAGRGVQLLVGLCPSTPIKTFLLQLAITGVSVALQVPVRGACGEFRPLVRVVAVMDVVRRVADGPVGKTHTASRPSSSFHDGSTTGGDNVHLAFGRVPARRRVSRRVDVHNAGSVSGRVWIWVHPATLAECITIDIASQARRLDLAPWDDSAQQQQQEEQQQQQGAVTTAVDVSEETWRGRSATRPSHNALSAPIRVLDNPTQLYAMATVDRVLVLNMLGRSMCPLEVSMCMPASENLDIRGSLVVSCAPPSNEQRDAAPASLAVDYPSMFGSASRRGSGAPVTVVDFSASVDINRMSWEVGEPPSTAPKPADQQHTHSPVDVDATSPSEGIIYQGVSSQASTSDVGAGTGAPASLQQLPSHLRGHQVCEVNPCTVL